MKFSKLKLVNGGLHGVTANYIEYEEKNNLHFENVITRERKAPATKDFKEAVKQLKSHLIDLCRINEAYAEDVEVTGISSDADGQFLITGKCRSIDETTFALNTPLIKREGSYSGFDTVIEIVKNIYEHAAEYFEKKLQPENRQILIDFAQANPDSEKLQEVNDGGERSTITVEEIEKMEEPEMLQVLAKVLERKGAMVMLPEELSKEETF